MAIQIGGGIFIGGGIGFDTGAPVASTYPTVSGANEVFKFNYNTLAATANLITDISSNTWQATASQGTTGLTQPSGGAFNDSGYYFRNAGTGSNGEGITALGDSNYATYHNNNIPASSWAFETHIYLENKATYDSGMIMKPYGSALQSGITIQQQSGSATAYRLDITFEANGGAGSGTGPTFNLADLTGGAWKHLVVSAVRTSAGNYRFYIFVDGVLQNAGGTAYNFVSAGIGDTAGLWSDPTNGSRLGKFDFIGSAPRMAYGLDNTRLIIGNPFPTSGFTAPTSAFTA